jgi:hypothetical protein
LTGIDHAEQVIEAQQTMVLSSKQIIPTINANNEKVARQEEGARIINMCFANAPVAVAA